VRARVHDIGVVKRVQTKVEVNVGREQVREVFLPFVTVVALGGLAPREAGGRKGQARFDRYLPRKMTEQTLPNRMMASMMRSSRSNRLNTMRRIVFVAVRSRRDE
jgi:hypothetical protein